MTIILSNEQQDAIVFLAEQITSTQLFQIRARRRKAYFAQYPTVAPLELAQRAKADGLYSPQTFVRDIARTIEDYRAANPPKP